MNELPHAIPDATVLLMLEPEELGGKLLFLLRNRTFQIKGMFNPAELNRELWRNVNTLAKTPYPQNLRDDIEVALTEAWAWLEAQGLIVQAPEGRGVDGWRILSRRAKRFEDETDFARYVKGRSLPRELLHPKLGAKVWLAYMKGDFDVAVFLAMKVVEVAVRDASGLDNSLVGKKLMQEAFRSNGPLADPSAEGGEQVARMELFSGAMGSFKNPQSHRDVDLDDPQEAMEIVLFANYLLRIVDARAVK